MISGQNKRKMVDMYEVSPKDVPANAQVIDVREDDEYAIDRAQGVIHIPMGDIPERYKEIDPDKDIYVICKAGGRSMQVCGYLENALGWDNVINVAGGTDAWRDQGLPMETPS